MGRCCAKQRTGCFRRIATPRPGAPLIKAAGRPRYGRRSRKQGCIGHWHPEDAGGFGVPVADALSLLKVAGAHAAPLPLAETMLASWLLASAGLNIPDGPLSAAPVRDGESLTLTSAGGDWRIAGTLTRIPWARDVNHLVVLSDARIVLAGRDSWRVEQGENVAREPRDTVHFDGVATAVAPTAVTATNLMAIGAAMRTQQIAGALTRITEMTTQYAQDRVQFGRPLGKFQAVQQNLAVLGWTGRGRGGRRRPGSGSGGGWDETSADRGGQGPDGRGCGNSSGHCTSSAWRDRFHL